jgi:hypothetical protein
MGFAVDGYKAPSHVLFKASGPASIALCQYPCIPAPIPLLNYRRNEFMEE